MATLRTIARAAGVHVATASAVLNPSEGNTRVSLMTRRRVLDAAKKLSYIPNESARRLKTGRSNVVGFLGGDLRNPFFSELTCALEAELARFDLQILVSHVTQAESVVIERTLLSLRQENVKCVICWEESVHPLSPRQKMDEAHLSIGFTRKERPGVWLDLENATQCAVEAMIQRGYRRLGFFFPRSQRESPSVAIRSEAFLEICRKRSMPLAQLASYDGESWDLFASIQGAARTLRDHPQVEAWISFNDIAGLGLLHGLSRERSDRVLCFDGTVAVRCWPGRPRYLDLKIPALARAVAAVVIGKQDAKSLGRRENWLRASLGTT